MSDFISTKYILWTQFEFFGYEMNRMKLNIIHAVVTTMRSEHTDLTNEMSVKFSPI
jgi:hypothetical protein